jgi:integrase
MATEFRVEDPFGRRKVLALAREKSEEAKAMKPILEQAAWENWVEQFIGSRYRNNSTVKRANGAWKVLREWLYARGLFAPSMVEYRHAQDWVDWRTERRRPNGNFISRNTALCDLRILAIIMREAMRRNYCQAVAIERCGIRKDRPKEKPEMTGEEIATIRQNLVGRSQWMGDAFEVAIHQGCRLRETQVPLNLVDEVRGLITFKIKGGRMHTTALNPGLIAFVRNKRSQGAARLVDLPPMPSKEWWTYFRELGMPHLCFHCTRVTVVTRMARAGVPIQQAMRFVGHASELIHRIYQRLAPQDLSPAVAALAFPSSDVTRGSRDVSTPTLGRDQASYTCPKTVNRPAA